MESVARRADCQHMCCQPLVNCGNQKPAKCLFPPTSHLPVPTEMLVLDLCPS